MTAADAAPPSGRRWLVFLPLAGFCCLAALFLVRLYAGDPSRLPSALIGHPVPDFTLKPVPGVDRPGLQASDFRTGHVSIINVFASWCAECHDEHDALLRLAGDTALAAKGVTIDGIAYKDNAEDARRYLTTKGNPYKAVGDDGSGRTGIDFGVYGVPETFVVGSDGTIAYKLVGAINDQTLAPLLAAIEKASR